MAQRIQKGTAATLQVAWTDADGGDAAAAGTVTIGVAQADGTVVIAAGTATLNPSTGLYTKALTPAQTATLTTLTATWADSGSGTSRTTTAEIVASHAFGVAEARRSDPSLVDPSKYPTADIVAARYEVEVEAEWICARRFTRGYRRLTVDGTGTGELRLVDGDTSVNDVRTVRSVTMYAYPGAVSPVTLTAGQLASLAIGDGVLYRTDSLVFSEGRQNVVLEVEYGLDEPSAEMRRAMLQRLRQRLNMNRSGIPDRAKTWTSAEGGTFDLARATTFTTGSDDIDAVYGRYSLRQQDGKMVAYSASLDMDPQRYSLFHGPRR